MVWIALAAMTGVAVLMALWPLAFRRAAPADDAREAAFYRAQLDEIARDVERGVLPEAEAAAARAEAARRLLAVSERAEPAPPAGATGRRRAAALAALVLIPAVALGVYSRVGEPNLPDAPISQRKPADPASPGGLEAAVAKIEAHLMKAPDDRRGWEVLAPVYMRMGRFADAGGAYRQMMRLGLDNPQTHANFGEALVAMADGVVTADARAEFEKAADLPMSKFYLALAADQDGKTEEAKAAYVALAPLARGREPWMMGLKSRLEALGGSGAAAPSAPPPAGGAPAFTPEQRKMIEGMVAGLADRLATKGGSAEEWARLIRAYTVLQEPDKAREALASARKALGASPDLDALAQELKL